MFDNPVKVMRQIRENHFSIGDLNEGSISKRFDTIMKHKLLIERTKTCLDTAEDKMEAEYILYIKDET